MIKTTFTNEQVVELAKLLKVIAEPKRLLLLEEIIRGVQCNCDLGESLGMAPNLISHHLGILRTAGLVTITRDPEDSRWVYYAINAQVMEDLRRTLDQFFSTQRAQPRRISCGPQSEDKVDKDLIPK